MRTEADKTKYELLCYWIRSEENICSNECRRSKSISASWQAVAFRRALMHIEDLNRDGFCWTRFEEKPKMRIKEVSYSELRSKRNKPGEPWVNHTAGCTVTVERNEKPDEAMRMAREFVETELGVSKETSMKTYAVLSNLANLIHRRKSELLEAAVEFSRNGGFDGTVAYKLDELEKVLQHIHDLRRKEQ